MFRHWQGFELFKGWSRGNLCCSCGTRDNLDLWIFCKTLDSKELLFGRGMETS